MKNLQGYLCISVNVMSFSVGAEHKSMQSSSVGRVA